LPARGLLLLPTRRLRLLPTRRLLLPPTRRLLLLTSFLLALLCGCAALRFLSCLSLGSHLGLAASLLSPALTIGPGPFFDRSSFALLRLALGLRLASGLSRFLTRRSLPPRFQIRPLSCLFDAAIRFGSRFFLRGAAPQIGLGALFGLPGILASHRRLLGSFRLGSLSLATLCELGAFRRGLFLLLSHSRPLLVRAPLLGRFLATIIFGGGLLRGPAVGLAGLSLGLGPCFRQGPLTLPALLFLSTASFLHPLRLLGPLRSLLLPLRLRFCHHPGPFLHLQALPSFRRKTRRLGIARRTIRSGPLSGNWFRPVAPLANRPRALLPVCLALLTRPSLPILSR